MDYYLKKIDTIKNMIDARIFALRNSDYHSQIEKDIGITILTNLLRDIEKL